MCISFFQKNENKISGLKRPQHYDEAVNVPIYYDFPELGIKNKEIQVKIFSVLPDEKTVQEYLIHMEEELINSLKDQYQGEGKIEGPIQLSNQIGKCKLDYQVFLRNRESEELTEQHWIMRTDLSADAVLDFHYTLAYQNQVRNGAYEIRLTKDSFHKDYEAFYAQEVLEEELSVRGKSGENEIVSLEEDSFSGSLEKHKIVFKRSADSISFMTSIVLLFLLLLTLSLLSHYEKREKESMILRQKTIELTYFINHFLLLYRTGLTIPKSFAMSTDHRGESMERRLLWIQDFQRIQKSIWSEMSFPQQLQVFLECFTIPQGRRFARLLSQNIKQGDHLLSIQLEQLSEGMWERRIRDARKESEKASTKLIFPMLVIFIVILILTIVPTFLEVNKYY